jgi:P-type E1-E2 ATPase
VRTVAFDKTGTLTTGRPTLVAVRATSLDSDELLRLVASAEQYSTHALAPAIVQAGTDAGLELSPSSNAREIATDGIEAEVDGHTILVGKPRFIVDRVGAVPRAEIGPGQLAVYAAVDGSFAGTHILSDPLRPNAADLISALHKLGVQRTMVLTGDAQATADHVARDLGLTAVHAELLPADKVSLLHEAPLRPVVMIGDGVNDAPVLAAADVGIAMGARGATAASESADVVVLADDIGKVATACSIARHTVHVALASIGLGIGLSLVLMLVAALGHIPAVVGALLQEGVDLLAIGVALGALRAGRNEIEL